MFSEMKVKLKCLANRTELTGNGNNIHQARKFQKMNKQTMNIEVYVEPNWHESLFVSLNENKKRATYSLL